MTAALAALLLPTAGLAAPPIAKPTLELQVFRADKAVGTELVREQATKEATYWSSSAQLQDKVNKVWRSFTERGHIPLGPKGEFDQYDRWIDVTGATSQAKLFQFNGQWRISFMDSAIDGKKPKPKVVDVKVKAPFIVLDERLPSLVAWGAERMAGKTEFDFVRVDDATTGHLLLTSERLEDKAGKIYHRLRMKGSGQDLEVLRDSGGHVLAIKGLDMWRAVAKDAKIPKDLAPAKAPAATATDPAPADATPAVPPAADATPAKK